MSYADGSSEQSRLCIAGFQLDDLADGSGKAPLTLAMDGLLSQPFTMNSSSTTAGGWQSCGLRTEMNNLFQALPSSWQTEIRSVNKLSSAGGSNLASLQTTSDKLWLPAENEIFASSSYCAASGEGEQYPLFAQAERHPRRMPDGTPAIYWLRSAASANMFCCVDSSGKPSASVAMAPRGVFFCCCL